MTKNIFTLWGKVVSECSVAFEKNFILFFSWHYVFYEICFINTNIGVLFDSSFIDPK